MNVTNWILPALLMLAWVMSWPLGTRRFRLWFALLAPFACGASVIFALFWSAGEADTSCYAPCQGGAVQQWAGSVDSTSGPGTWLGVNSLYALGVALALTTITLIVEYILLVLRDSHEARSRRENDHHPR